MIAITRSARDELRLISHLSLDRANGPDSAYLRSSLSIQERNAVSGSFSGIFFALSQSLDELIQRAEHHLNVLKHLDEDLDFIFKTVVWEHGRIKEERRKIMGSLWTRMGWNYKEMQALDEDQLLTQQTAHWKQCAEAHVMSTLQTLRSYAAELESLHHFISSPGFEFQISLVHALHSIENSLVRLLENQQKTRMHSRRIEAWAAAPEAPATGLIDP
jgi:hypothetical protein